MKIWEMNCTPALYAFPENEEPPRCNECVLDTIREILEQNRVETRRYVMDQKMHNHPIPDETEPDI